MYRSAIFLKIIILYIIAVPIVMLGVFGGEFLGPKGEELSQISGFGLMALLAVLMIVFLFDLRSVDANERKMSATSGAGRSSWPWK